MNATIKGIQDREFYLDEKSIEWMTGEAGEPENVFAEGADFRISFIEQPLVCDIKAVDDKMNVNVYLRSAIGILEDCPDLQFEYDREFNIEVTQYNGNFGDEIETLLLLFWDTSMWLTYYYHEMKLEEEYEDFDSEHEGILVRFKDGDMRFQRVTGRQRPDLAATQLFGGIEKCRPYMDEVLEQFLCESLSWDETLESAEMGEEESMVEVCNAYLTGYRDDVEQDVEQAAYWSRKLAEAGNVVGMHTLGLQYLKGEGLPRSVEEAAHWLELSVKNGYFEAESLADRCRDIIEKKEKAESGDMEAMAAYAGQLMAVGNAIDDEYSDHYYEASISCAKTAAAANEGEAFWVLGLAYEHGRSVDQDSATAVTYFTKGADLGHAACQHSLGCHYIQGDGVDVDKRKAFELFNKSAEQGYGLAIKAVGICYQFAHGCKGNMKKAVEWYEKALEVIDDPELAQKTEVFKMLGEKDEHWGEDYDDDDMEE